MKVLTKSRFKLDLECSNKLYYTRKKEYADTEVSDTFLEALAQGGFQVEENYQNGLAKIDKMVNELVKRK